MNIHNLGGSHDINRPQFPFGTVILVSNIGPLILLVCKGLLFNICSNSLEILLCECKI